MKYDSTHACSEISGRSESIQEINSDLDNIADFSVRNCLKLNNDKSNYIIIGSRQNLVKLSKTPVPPVKIANIPIERKNHVKNLGVIFDDTLSWDKHINKCVGTAYGKFKQAFRFKKFLSQEAKLNISEMYILSQFNYCDSLFLNASQIFKNKIKKVQNNSLRFSLDLRKFDPITTHRKKLGLLDMDSRRIFYSLTLMHKIVKNIEPSYLCTRIKHTSEIHNYNTRNRQALTVNHIKTAKNPILSLAASKTNTTNFLKILTSPISPLIFSEINAEKSYQQHNRVKRQLFKFSDLFLPVVFAI